MDKFDGKYKEIAFALLEQCKSNNLTVEEFGFVLDLMHDMVSVSIRNALIAF